MEPRPFTLNEENILKMLLKTILISIPSNNKYRKVVIPSNTIHFQWEKLEPRTYVSQIRWWTSVVSVSYPQCISVVYPTKEKDIKIHLLRIAPRLVAQVYKQLDFKSHRLAHILNQLFNKDDYGSYRRNYRKAIAFYKSVRDAYKQITIIMRRGLYDLEEQHEQKKALYAKYGRAVDVALRLYRMPI